MATLHYTALAKDSRLLELPEEAKALGLKPGDEVSVSVNVNGYEAIAQGGSNDEALATMRQIAERHKDRRITDNSSTQRLLHEARGGAAYGYGATE